MRIAIVDDLVAERARLTQMLTAELHATHTDIHKLDTFDSAEAFLENWSAEKYDLVLLDIYMGGATKAMRLASATTCTSPPPPMISGE